MDLSTIEKFHVYKDQEQCDPMVAAILVLADAIERAGHLAGITDSDGVVNVNLTGSVDTSGK